MKGKIKKLQKGFTLVEMITVISIIGALSAIIVPSVFKYIRKAQRRVDTANAKQIWELVTMIVNEAEAGELDGVTSSCASGTYNVYNAFYNTKGSAKFFGGVQVFSGGSVTPETYDLMVVAKISGRKGSSWGSRNRFAWVHGVNENDAFVNELNDRMVYGGDSLVGDSGQYRWAMKYLTHKDDVNADQWLICWRKQDKRIEIWSGDSAGAGDSAPLYRVWPDPCDDYSNSTYNSSFQHANNIFRWTG